MAQKSTAQGAAKHKVRIWDLPTRLFHWLLAATVIALVVTAKLGGNAMNWHLLLGHAMLALLLFRLLWGLLGGRWSRFASFMHAPATVLRHVRGQGTESDSAGHSPLGALSVFAMLAVLVAQVGSGLLRSADRTGAGLERRPAGAAAQRNAGRGADGHAGQRRRHADAAAVRGRHFLCRARGLALCASGRGRSIVTCREGATRLFCVRAVTVMAASSVASAAAWAAAGAAAGAAGTAAAADGAWRAAAGSFSSV